MSAIGNPQQHERKPEGNGEASPFERHRSERAEQPADADRGGQIADLARASVKNTEDGDDDQHVQAAADESLCDAERDDQRSVGCARDCLEAGQDHPASGLVLGRRGELDPALDPHPRERCSSRDEQSGADDEDDANISERDENARQQWSNEGAEAFDRRRRPVGCDELLRRSCQRRQQRLQCRPDERRGDADERGERVDEELGAGESRRPPTLPGPRRPRQSWQAESARGGIGRLGERPTAQPPPQAEGGRDRPARPQTCRRARMRTRRARRSEPTRPRSPRPMQAVPAGRCRCERRLPARRPPDRDESPAD